MKRVRGFTLLELMIVITIVAVLAAFAITAYSEQVRKSKRSEAMKSIAQFQLLMEKHRSSCPSYADDASATNNCKDRNNDGDGSDAGVDAAYPSMPDAPGNNYTYAITGTPTATTYVITATKKASFTDPKCGNFIMTVAAGVSTRSVSSGDLSYCWP